MRKMFFVDRYIAGISLRMKENKCNTILYVVKRIKQTYILQEQDRTYDKSEIYYQGIQDRHDFLFKSGTRVAQ